MKSCYMLFVIVALCTACSLFQSEPTTVLDSTRSVASVLPFLSIQRPSCHQMVKDFCDTLFSPDHQGTLKFNVADTNYEIRMGRTANDFWQKDYEFMNGKMRAWTTFPKDLKSSLGGPEFLNKMKRYLSRGSPDTATIQTRIRNLRDEDEMNYLWNLALKETVLTRMEKQFPGYSRIKEDLLPLELRYESQRQRRMLLSEIAKAIWTDHTNWKRVESKFLKVRETYIEMIQENPAISAELKSAWISRLSNVKLVVPGSDPELDMDDCFKNESNAYYFRDKNYVTVCAGDFNTEEIEQTLAHELGHALDLGRSRLIFQEQSKVGKRLAEVKGQSCQKGKFNCDIWRATRDEFQETLKGYGSYEAELPQFNSCLKGKETKSPIPGDYIARVAHEEAESTISDLAERNVFLRVISPKLPMVDGSAHRNPMYLNPCGYYLWDNQAHPLEDDVSLLLFFTAEYRCSKETIPEDKFKNAIETAKRLQIDLVKARLAIEGQFSGRDRLNTDGYSSSPNERFADSVGQMVFARLLTKEQNLTKRRAAYLANNAWLCRRPSIQQLFPNEATVQKNYFVEPHSELSQRQKELLTKEIREALDCNLDFESKECPIGNG